MKRILSIALAVIVCSCSLLDRTDRSAGTLDTYFSSVFPPDEPGGAVLVMKGDSIVFTKGYGIADVRTKDPITTKTLFNLGSVSKTFVANAVLMLQEQGKLSVEDSIIKYFPNFKKPELARKVKIKHLLTHTSGLPDSREVERDSVFYLTARDAENWHPVTQCEYLVFTPGTRYEYSNPAFNALALIVEQVSGTKWQSFVEQNIMRSAGMSTSTITDGPHPATGVAHAYVRNGTQWVEDDYGEEPTFAAAGNGGVWSSVEELAKYERALHDTVFLTKASVAESRTVQDFRGWAGARKPFIGWSWFIERNPAGVTTVGHTGSQGGFLCNYVSIPEKDLFFVILCNTPRDVEAMTNRIFTWLNENNWLD